MSEASRKTRLDKRPDLLKFNLERERDQHSPNFVTSSNENTSKQCTTISQTDDLEEQKKTNLIQKSWKRLMEGYKGGICYKTVRLFSNLKIIFNYL